MVYISNMKLHHKVLISAVAVGALTVGIHQVLPNGVFNTGHVAPANLYPDPTLTPGVIVTTNPADIQAKWCVDSSGNATIDTSGQCSLTYSASHRNVPDSEKQAVYAEYENLYSGITAYCEEPGFTSGANQRCEVDHFCPVGIGCGNDIGNLSIQRADGTFNGQPMGFHQKDMLEAWGIAQVKAGTLQPADFDKMILGDWVKAYLDNIVNKTPNLGGYSPLDTPTEQVD